MSPKKQKSDVRAAAIANGWCSGLEEQTAEEMTQAGVKFTYESFRIPWVPTPRINHYTPDFHLTEFGWILETKGRWVTADRKKIKTVVAQYPDLEIRILFSNAQARISKTSKTTYAKVCDTLGIQWAHRHFPKEWASGPVNHVSLAAVQRLMKESKK